MLRRALAALAASLVVVAPAALAGDGAAMGLEPAGPAPEPTAGVPASGTWFVEMSSPPTADGTSLSEVKSEQATFRAEAKEAGIKVNERYAFAKLWNGVSVTAGSPTATALSQLPSVKSVSPAAAVEPPQGGTFDPQLATSVAMIGADVAQNDLGLDGAGVRVAIIDTGLDYDHPDLGGSGAHTGLNFPNSRVAGGWDFVGDTYNATETSPAYQPVRHPDADPDDCNGHGTHVAGIVGADGAPASGGARGVAPAVTLSAYRVFGCSGSATADVLLAAMERVAADGADVVNISIGEAFNNWPDSPTARAADRLVNKGMVVVSSVGNNGANGVYSAGAPGVGGKVISVASYENSHLRAFTVTPDDHVVPYFGSTGSPPAPPFTGTYEIKETPAAAAVGAVPPNAYPSTFPDGCTAFPAGYFAGKVALIRRGTAGCVFNTKVQNAEQAGAIAVVLYNTPGTAPLQPNVTQGSIPTVLIGQADGELIHNRLVSGPVSLTWRGDLTPVNPFGGLISGPSAYGTAADLTLKPDLGAPGGLIRSTWALEGGAYRTFGGTSMASAHVAGAAALLLQARPKLHSQAVRGILQNTAEPAPWAVNPGLGFLDNVHRQGAGLVHVDHAVLAPATVTPGKLSLGESEAGPATRTLTVENDSATSITYALSHTPALSTGGSTFAPSFFTGFASMDFSQLGVPVTSVEVPAFGRATFEVTVTADPTLAERSLYGGYLVLTPQDDGQVLRVPYAGFKGDYQSIQAITPGGAAALPKLARHVDYLVSPAAFTPAYQPVTAPTYTMTETPDPDAGGRPIRDIPFVAVHLDHQVRELKAEVFRAGADKRVGVAFDFDYVPRNDVPTASFATSTGFFPYGWNGRVRKGKDTVDVADGDYYFKLTALEALGDEANPAHVESWTSGDFTVDRP